MKPLIYLGTFLFVIINVNSFTVNTTEANLPYIFQTSLWEHVFKQIQDQKRLIPITYQGPDIKADIGLCAVCNLVVGAILMERGFYMTNIQMSAEAQYMCSDLLKIFPYRVCEGAVDSYIEPLGYIMDNQKNLNAKKVCNLFLGCNSSSTDFEWTIDIPAGKTVPKVNSTGTDTFKIAHLTDVHYDPRYTVGKTLKCEEPLCCQDDQSDAAEGENSCGYWGSLEHADIPLRLINETITEMNKQDFDYVYFTGDIVAHRVWETSQESNAESISTIMDFFADNFKKPVYPILGNHETHPTNMYTPLNITDKSLSDEWLFDLVFTKWSKWLGEDVKETVKTGGYYTVTPKPGFRVIVLNNNVCQRQNWWNLYDDYDPYGQLKWLAETLKKAENSKEIVHILAHIPNNLCTNVWSREYNKLIERFSNTIAAQFNGHTHKDSFSIFYDSKKNPNNVVFNGGSLMPSSSNPNFKIYTVDNKGYDVIDAELYTFDLENANANKEQPIKWEKLYSYQKEFGLKKLVPSELDDLVKRMKNGIKDNDNTLINKYHNNYYRNSKYGQDPCDENCAKRYLCEMVTTLSAEIENCKK